MLPVGKLNETATSASWREVVELAAAFRLKVPSPDDVSRFNSTEAASVRLLTCRQFGHALQSSPPPDPRRRLEDGGERRWHPYLHPPRRPPTRIATTTIASGDPRALLRRCGRFFTLSRSRSRGGADDGLRLALRFASRGSHHRPESLRPDTPRSEALRASYARRRLTHRRTHHAPPSEPSSRRSQSFRPRRRAHARRAAQRRWRKPKRPLQQRWRSRSDAAAPLSGACRAELLGFSVAAP